eukprot:3826350-Rhodomonas_salina.2
MEFYSSQGCLESVEREASAGPRLLAVFRDILGVHVDSGESEVVAIRNSKEARALRAAMSGVLHTAAEARLVLDAPLLHLR